jgi:hypothetical protein
LLNVMTSPFSFLTHWGIISLNLLIIHNQTFFTLFTVIGYPSEDGSTGPSEPRTYIMTSETVPQQTRLVNFKLFTKNTNPVYLQIWRRSNTNDASDNTYTVVHTQQYVPTQTDKELVVGITVRLCFIIFHCIPLGKAMQIVRSFLSVNILCPSQISYTHYFR